MEYLSRKGVSFTSKDVANDEQAYQEFAKLHSPGTPTVVIDGQVIIGFNAQRLDAALA
jgi:hypothetical protein